MNRNIGKKRITARMIAVILCFLLVITLTPDTGRAEETPESSQLSPEELEQQDMALSQDDVDRSDVIKAENTKESTTYALGSGKKMTVIYGQDVRYEDVDGKLIDIDPSLTAVKQGEKTESGRALTGYTYENKAG